MSKPDPKKLAQIKMASRQKTAGEVRFIKDRGDDSASWAWNDHRPSQREITPDYAFDPKNIKPLAKVLRASAASMGHALSAYHQFCKIKSATVSPDGYLGGKGYIQQIVDIRKAYMNVVESLSAITDTLYDEVRAPHWAAVSRQETPEEKQEISDIVDDVDHIKDDPEGWAREEEEEMSSSNQHKMARSKKASGRVAGRYLQKRDS
jgi:hypothetical protein